MVLTRETGIPNIAAASSTDAKRWRIIAGRSIYKFYTQMHDLSSTKRRLAISPFQPAFK